MNKKLFLSACLLGAFGTLLHAENVRVRQYLHAGPVEVNEPILADSVNVNGKKFEVKDLLNARLTFPETGAALLETDTAGYLLLQAPAQAFDLHLFRFYLHNDRYVKGTLEVSGPGMFEVYVNGEKKGAKTSVESELEKSRSVKAELEMLPYRYEVTVKYLASQKDSCPPAIRTVFNTAEKSGVTADTDPEKNYSLYNILNGTNFRGVSLSPNGKYAIIRYYETFPGGKSVYYTDVAEAGNGRLLMRLTGDAGNVDWMPAGNRMYYTREGMKGRELVTVDPESRQENVVAGSLPAGYFTIAPDESYLLYSVQEQGPKENKELARLLDPDDRIPGWRNRTFLYRYDLKTGLYEQLTFGHTSTHLNDISADSRYILFSTSQRALTSRPFSRGSLYRLDMQTLQVDTIWENQKYLYGASFSPDGKQLLVQAAAEAFDGIGLNIREGQTSNSYDSQLFIFDPATRKATPLTKNFDPSVESAVWNKFDNRIYFKAEDRDYQHVFRCDPRTGKISQLPTEEEVVFSMSLAENAPAMLYYGQSVSNASRLYLLDLKSGKSKLLADRTPERLEDVELGEVHDWNFTSADGTTITGRYYLPPHFDPQKKYPMIVYYYGGTSPTNRMLEGPYSMHLYAAQGYVVYTLNPSGTTGFGQEFAARHVNAWGKVTADEIIRGTELFCREHAFVNKSKIGCIGASYGGFMTQYLQTRTDLFAAAVSHAGISNITSYWGEGYWGYSYSQAASADSYPWNNPELYTRQSPLFNADKIKTPLLLLHGNADTNVPIGESIQMFNALKLLGKTVEFVQVDGENHGIANYQKRIAWKNTIFAWFAKWLKDEPQWWNALYPERNL